MKDGPVCLPYTCWDTFRYSYGQKHGILSTSFTTMMRSNITPLSPSPIRAEVTKLGNSWSRYGLFIRKGSGAVQAARFSCTLTLMDTASHSVMGQSYS